RVGGGAGAGQGAVPGRAEGRQLGAPDVHAGVGRDESGRLGGAGSARVGEGVDEAALGLEGGAVAADAAGGGEGQVVPALERLVEGVEDVAHALVLGR